jgi:hypothetical protein
MDHRSHAITNTMAETLPVLTWNSMMDKKSRPIGMFECMSTGILWLFGEDNEG